MLSLFRILLALGTLFLSLTIYAQEPENFLIVPNCLLTGKFDFKEIAKVKNLVLIQTSDMSGLQTARIKKHSGCRGFINVTAQWNKITKKSSANATQLVKNYFAKAHAGNELRGYRIQFQDQVNALLQSIDKQSMQMYLTSLAAFKDRDANSDGGVDASNWLLHQVKTMVANHADIELKTLSSQGQYSQPSIWVKFGKNVTGAGIVLGTHFDTLPSNKESKPGADDNASGTATLLEILHVLAKNQVKLQRPVYLIWYAAEEKGEIGSQTVVNYFKRQHIPIAAALNLDKTGYKVKEDNGIGLTDDYTDISLTAFVADLVATYVNLTASAVHCGFACSDHISWYQDNIPVAYPYETIDDAENPYTLTRFDKIGLVSVDHMMDFAKLGLAFAVELASTKDNL